jgi:hypothetical protein
MKAQEEIVKFSTTVKKLPHLPGHYIEVPAKIVEELGGSFKLRLLCSVNGHKNFQCGLVALGNGDAYISLNLARMKEFSISKGDEIRVTLEHDPSKYGMKMPAELAEVLRQDQEGNRRYALLAPGKQRYLIYYVSMVKSSQLRVERALRLISNLKQTKPGKESFKELLA